MTILSVLRVLVVLVILATGTLFIYDAVLSQREAEKIKECEAIWTGESAGVLWLTVTVPHTPEEQQANKERLKNADTQLQKCLKEAHQVRLFNRWQN